jgi:hypothetical protein
MIGRASSLREGPEGRRSNPGLRDRALDCCGADAPRNDGSISAFLTFVIAAVISLFSILPALAASGRQPAPDGAFKGAPAQYTRFTAAELTRGFMALAFGSDLRVGARAHGIHRFDHPIRVRISSSGGVDRSAAMRGIVEHYAREVPKLDLSLAEDGQPADIDVRLIDERDFKSALVAAFGDKIARAFVARTNPQCMTSVKSNTDGEIVHAISFIIVDKGEAVFLDCAYHELLHAFGLSNHDARNPWTTLNQKRMVGYLTVYDRALLTLLYDPRILPGMTPARLRAVLPDVIRDLGLAKRTKSNRAAK